MRHDPPHSDILSRLSEESKRHIRLAADPVCAAHMRRWTAAAALLIAGKRGSEMTAPEPFVQAGFEPTPATMQLMALSAERMKRDLIHIAFHQTAPFKPVGMVAVAFIDGGKAIAHRASALVCAPSSSTVVLAGVSDDDDRHYRFVLRPGMKMERVPGRPAADLRSGLIRAGAFWSKLVDSGALRDCSGETIQHYSLVEAARGASASASTVLH